MKKIVPLFFFLGLAVRFLYFPENVYFGFDQARDAFESQNIFKNLDIKIIGPSTAAENLFHGPVYWYIIGPFYLLGDGNPALPAAFLLFLNSLGVFIVFLLGRLLFNNFVGVISALLYAVSFEQTQYSLYFGNPAPAVLTIMTFYGGLAAAIFKKKWVGIPIALASLGLSIQFEFFLVYLFLVFIVLVLIFQKTILGLLNLRRIFISFIVLLVSVSNFIAAEFLFGFRTTKTLVGVGKTAGGIVAPSAYLEKFSLHIKDNVFSFSKNIEIGIFILILTICLFLIFKKGKYYQEVFFLLFWFLSAAFIYIFGIPKLYYSDIGVSAGLIILVSYLLWKLYLKFRPALILVIATIILSNVVLIKDNRDGVIHDIYVQEGMLLEREKQALDYIYQQADGRPIVVSAMTMPLKINTTWAYLFNWYGKERYGYLPYWAGEVAPGYPGHLPRWQSQEEDYVAFSIIEPTRGVRQAFVEEFLEDQRQYGEVQDEKIFGGTWYAQLVVQKRGER